MSETITIKPINYTDDSGVDGPAGAYDNDNTTYAYIRASTNVKSTSTTSKTSSVYYIPDLSAIPANAEITKVKIIVVSSCSQTSYDSTKYSQSHATYVNLYNNTTNAGTLIIENNSSVNTQSQAFISTAAKEWAFGENPRIRAYASISGKKLNSSASTVTFANTFKLYEVSVEIECTIPAQVKVNNSWKGTNPFMKVDGDWLALDTGYVKVNGAWKEIT